VTQDEAAPTTIADFRARLRALRAAAGDPSYAALGAAARGGGAMLAKATLSEFCRDVHPHRLPRQDFVRAFVRACLTCTGASTEHVDAEVARFDRWWTALVLDLGLTPPPPPAPTLGDQRAEAVDDATPSPTRRTWQRWAVIALAVTLAGAGGFAAGVLTTTGWSYPWSSDPSLSLGPCAEAIGPATRVGSTVLLFEIGPHGKEVQDRRIELRVQRHPERGWVAWARLERSSSAADRLWLDWSYFRTPGDQSQFRQCGSQMVTDSRETPAILVEDDAGRHRWFRACGQVPTADRAPDQSGTFCTSWSRPRT
jgi:hypothetical protein